MTLSLDETLLRPIRTISAVLPSSCFVNLAGDMGYDARNSVAIQDGWVRLQIAKHGTSKQTLCCFAFSHSASNLSAV